MSKFIMMCGLPGSGKSRLANRLSKDYDAVILSSDEIRKEFLNDVNNQDHNADIFNVMNMRVKKLLSEKKNVIYDATNINRKRRVHLINHEIKADEKEICYMNNRIQTTYYQDSQRGRTVGKDVINRMYKTLQIPTKNEGWDKVTFHSSHGDYYFKYRESMENVLLSDFEHDKLFNELGEIVIDFGAIFNLPQDSSYHSFSVSRHTYYVYKYIMDNYNHEDKLMMLYAAIFHDLGKGFCKSFTNHKGEINRYANFIGHDLVSSQLAVYWLSLLGYEDDFIKQVGDLIQFHMIHNISDKKLSELNKLIGDELYQKLMILHEADLSAK